MDILKSVYLSLTEKFNKIQLLFLAGLIVFVLFISDTNIFTRFGHDAKIRELNRQIEYYRDQAAHDKKQIEQLNSNKEDIEKFARENYLMKKANEDIFIVE